MYLASGIGLATAILLKKAGWLICLVDRNVEVGEKEAKNLDCEFYQTDVTDYSSLASTFDKAYIKHGRLDFVFANAGIMGSSDFYEQQKTTPTPQSLSSSSISTSSL